MEYLLKKIKKHIITVFTVALILAFISGYGIKIVTDTKFSASSMASAKDSGKDTNTFNKVPVYGKNQKAKIKKYLSSLPDEITVTEAKKKGIIISAYDSKVNKQFQKDWMDFYKYARAGEKEYNSKYEAVICYAKAHNKRAIVLLSYTVEGDACYTYVSFINGTYYVLNDSSRDKYKASSWDGYSNLMVYKSLRKYKPDKSTNMKDLKSNHNIEFYLFKKQNITRKKMIKIINNNYKYAVDYYSIYHM